MCCSPLSLGEGVTTDHSITILENKLTRIMKKTNLPEIHKNGINVSVLEISNDILQCDLAAVVSRVFIHKIATKIVLHAIPPDLFLVSFLIFDIKIVYNVKVLQCDFSFVDMSHNGTLASKQSINLLTYYSIAQCMFVFVCVSCRYRLIVYHVSTTHVDISRMISVKQLWDVFVTSSSSASTLKHGSKEVLSNLTGYSPRVNELDEQLRKYMDAKTPAIHIYTVRYLVHSDIVFGTIRTDSFFLVAGVV